MFFFSFVGVYVSLTTIMTMWYSLELYTIFKFVTRVL